MINYGRLGQMKKGVRHVKRLCASVALLTAIVISPRELTAANKFVRAGATGLANGSDWTNAFTSLPSTLTRGDTYFIGDGEYPAFNIQTAPSGSTFIAIQKATGPDHGTDTGWDPSFGDGQAVFDPPLRIVTSYIVFDGMVGSGSNPDTYGFKIATPSNCSQENRLIGVPPVGYNTLEMSNVRVSHVAGTNCGSSYNFNQIAIYSNPLRATNMTLSHNYLANCVSNILIRDWFDSSITDNFLNAHWSSSTNHGQLIDLAATANITIANNVFKDATTFAIGAHNEGGGNSSCKVYNNIVVGGTMTACFAMAESAEYDGFVDSQFHHNTFINTDCGGRGAVFVGLLTDVEGDKSFAYDNVFYNTKNPRMDNPLKTTGAIVHTHNAHFVSTGIFDMDEGGTVQIGSDDPFVDAANGNYRLKAETAAGKALAAPFNVDRDGRTRGSDNGMWNRGAHNSVQFPSPVNLRVE